MPYFIDQSQVPLTKIFQNNDICAFIRSSIETSKKLELGSFEKVTYNDSIFAITLNSIVKDRDQCIYESHKKYVDIHIIVDGCESVDLIDIQSAPSPFESSLEKDYYLYQVSESLSTYELKKNMLAVFLFEDVHKTGIRSNPFTDNVIKVVLKVDTEVFEQVFCYE